MIMFHKPKNMFSTEYHRNSINFTQDNLKNRMYKGFRLEIARTAFQVIF